MCALHPLKSRPRSCTTHDDNPSRPPCPPPTQSSCRRRVGVPRLLSHPAMAAGLTTSVRALVPARPDRGRMVVWILCVGSLHGLKALIDPNARGGGWWVGGWSGAWIWMSMGKRSSGELVWWDDGYPASVGDKIRLIRLVPIQGLS